MQAKRQHAFVSGTLRQSAATLFSRWDQVLEEEAAPCHSGDTRENPKRDDDLPRKQVGGRGGQAALDTRCQREEGAYPSLNAVEHTGKHSAQEGDTSSTFRRPCHIIPSLEQSTVAWHSPRRGRSLTLTMLATQCSNPRAMKAESGPSTAINLPPKVCGGAQQGLHTVQIGAVERLPCCCSDNRAQAKLGQAGSLALGPAVAATSYLQAGLPAKLLPTRASQVPPPSLPLVSIGAPR